MFSKFAVLFAAALCALVISASARVNYDWEKPTEVEILTEADFKSKISSGKWVVTFYAPWCSNSKKFAPTLDAAAKKLKPSLKAQNVHIARVDCVKFDGLCDAHNVDGYPTVFPFVNGKQGAEYDGDRTLRDFAQFVREI
ncbi:thioredoxin-like protein [Catenaria anguillulae PL171]|uniref:Thioredoxin-like protein n=1 Tax=Catenaria anguillulae PL171 TaxID=765915 RepID=A0A1Y2HJG1_9FUNG|nr:thioredoxin-like protein [Catenaria anguillulae PL171]